MLALTSALAQALSTWNTPARTLPALPPHSPGNPAHWALAYSLFRSQLSGRSSMIAVTLTSSITPRIALVLALTSLDGDFLKAVGE